MLRFVLLKLFRQGPEAIGILQITLYLRSYQTQAFRKTVDNLSLQKYRFTSAKGVQYL